MDTPTRTAVDEAASAAAASHIETIVEDLRQTVRQTMVAEGRHRPDRPRGPSVKPYVGKPTRRSPSPCGRSVGRRLRETPQGCPAVNPQALLSTTSSRWLSGMSTTVF